MIIAVDFDGTIVEHKFPAIGKDMPFAFETMREMQRQGHLLILWTYRAGKELDAAVDYCKKKGIEFYAVNKSYPEEVFEVNKVSRKVNADLFIDDRNVGGFYGWGEIWQELDLGGDQAEINKKIEQAQGGAFCRFIKNIFCR
ncbi:BT0820 family HAD-type phosphatase [Saccharicrinis aurantiacus]|uniref:BT0820 family HAD-type phosphatase n=1 Tax=Saccharicrinis aurantiacus TaxID=1849719 RepID=UPI0009502FC6|nr:hydrolase [Saccharicrinis aurantiacus]